MRRSLIALIATPVAALTLGLAPGASHAGTSVGTPIARIDTLVAAPCPTYYKTVNLTITDWGVQLNGAPAPKCIRLWSNGTLKILNNASAEATVTFEGDTNMMVLGELWNYQPIGAWYAAGSVLDFSVDELAGSALSIQVF